MVLFLSGWLDINPASIVTPLMPFGVFKHCLYQNPLYNNNWGLFTIWGLSNQFGCCTLKPNTFPMRTTGGASNVIQYSHVHLGCNVLEWYIHTWKVTKKDKKQAKKRQKKKTQKHIYVQCRLWCKWHNRWKRTNFLRETINIVLYSFILSACFVVFFVNMEF